MEYKPRQNAPSQFDVPSSAESFTLPPVQCYEYDVDKICPRPEVVTDLVLERAIELRRKYGTERTHGMIWQIKTGDFAAVLAVARDIDHLEASLRGENPTEVYNSTGSFYWNVLAEAWGVPLTKLPMIRLAGDLAYRFLMGGNRSESLGSAGPVFGGGSFFNSDDDAEPFVHIVPGLKEGETPEMADEAVDYLRRLGVRTLAMYSYKTKRELAEEAEAERFAAFTERNRREVQENLRNEVSAFLETLETESRKILYSFESAARQEVYQRLQAMPGESYNSWYRRVVQPDKGQDGMRMVWHALLSESNRRDARSFEEIIRGLAISHALKNSETFREIFAVKSDAFFLLRSLATTVDARELVNQQNRFNSWVEKMGHFIQDVPVQVSSSKPKEIPYSPEQAFALRQRLALVQAIRVFLQEVYLWNKEKQKTEKKSFRDTWNTLGSKLQSYNLNESTLTDLQHEIERLTAGDPLNQRIHTTDAIETAAFESLKGAVPLMPPVANKAIPRVIGLLGGLNRVIDQQSPHDQEKIRASTLFTRDRLLPVVKQLLSGAELDYEELLLPFV
jgi:hypothetical protein